MELPLCRFFDTVTLWSCITRRSQYTRHSWMNGLVAKFHTRQPPKYWQDQINDTRPDVDALLPHFVKGTHKKVFLSQISYSSKGNISYKSLRLTNFKAVRGWCYRFIQRRGMLLRHRASIFKRSCQTPTNILSR